MKIWMAKRILTSLLTVLGSTLLIFILIRSVPGDPATNLIGERGASPEMLAEMRSNMGLDHSLPIQYLIFVREAFRGNLGKSLVSQESINQEFWSRIPATLELSLAALLWSFPLALLMGCWAALRRGTFFDSLSMGISTLGYSMPLFWWALIMIVVFSVKLGWFPVSGRVDIAYDIPRITGFYLIDAWFSPERMASFSSVMYHLLLPSFVLGTIPLAMITRIVRNSMTEILNEDYIRTAKAKGVGQRQIVFKHALKNGLIPIVTGFGLLLATLVTGAVLTETIFSWPGVGRWIVKGLEGRDYPLLQGGLLYLSGMVVGISFLVDLSYFYLNPKLREQSEK